MATAVRQRVPFRFSEDGDLDEHVLDEQGTTNQAFEPLRLLTSYRTRGGGRLVAQTERRL